MTYSPLRDAMSVRKFGRHKREATAHEGLELGEETFAAFPTFGPPTGDAGAIRLARPDVHPRFAPLVEPRNPFLKLATRDRNSGDSEEGAALFAVVIVAVVIFLTLSTIAMNALTSVRHTSTVVASSEALMSADSGTDAGLASALSPTCERALMNAAGGFSVELYRSSFHLQRPDSTDSYGTEHGCPREGDRYLLVKATGEGKGGVVKEVLSVYQWGDGSDEEAFDPTSNTSAMPNLLSRVES